MQCDYNRENAEITESWEDSPTNGWMKLVMPRGQLDLGVSVRAEFIQESARTRPTQPVQGQFVHKGTGSVLGSESWELA